MFPGMPVIRTVRISDGLRNTEVPDVIDLMPLQIDGPVEGLTSTVPWISAARILASGALLARPDVAARACGLDRTRPAVLIVRGLAVREFVLGTGALVSWGRGGPVARWIGVQAVSDTLDCALFLAATRVGALPPVRGYALVAFAAGGVLTKVATVRAFARMARR